MLYFRKVRFTCILAGAMTMQSCVYDDLEACEGKYYMNLEVDYHWILAPDATPEGMACFFFPQAGGPAWRFDIPGSERGTVRLPNSSYRFVTLNDDFSSVILEGENSYSAISVTTLPCSLLDGAGSRNSQAVPPSRTSAPGQEVRMCPDMIWSDAIPSVIVGLDELTYTTRGDSQGKSETETSPYMLLPAHPRQLTSRYHYTITGVSHLDGVARMSGSLSGVAASIDLADGRHSDVGVTVPIDARRMDSTTIGGEFFTFGLTSGAGMRNILSLYVWLNDGRRLSYEFDVTAQTTTAPDPADVWIYIDGLELPESGAASGAFDVNVDTWHTVVINITG